MTHNERCRNYYLRHREEILVRSRKWYLENKEKIKIRSKNYPSRRPEILRVRTKKWREANPEKYKAQLERQKLRRTSEGIRRARLKSVYGITEEQFQILKLSQDNKCEICQKIFNKTPYIDHDHITGKNRGLLCQFCNLILGNADDKVEILERAIQYLKKYGEIECVSTDSVTPI